MSCTQVITQDLWAAGGYIPVRGVSRSANTAPRIETHMSTTSIRQRPGLPSEHAPRLGVAIWAGPHNLHDVLAFGYVNLKSGVIQVERLSPVQASLDRLIDPSVHPDEPCATGTKWDPVQVDADPAPSISYGCLVTNHRLFLIAVARFLMPLTTDYQSRSPRPSES